MSSSNRKTQNGLRADTQLGSVSGSKSIHRQSKRSNAVLEDLDLYMERLYDDDVESKQDGASRILKLAMYAMNTEQLVENEALMALLSRVLNDDYKKNSSLTTTLLRIFWCFSTFAQLHPLLGNFSIGATTLKIVEFEIRRHQLRALEEEASAELSKTSAEALEVYQHERKRNRKRLRKQNQLLLLMKLAEDLRTERKMVKKKIIVYLAKMLDRTSANLELLVLTFLKKLSIFQENNETMTRLGVPEKLVMHLSCNHDKTIQMSLKLLHNLSFDPQQRDVLVKNSIIPKLVTLLKKPPFRASSLRILYHLSMDDRCKSMFTYTDALPIVMQLVINFPQHAVAKELAALSVNLSLNARNAEFMCQRGGLEALVKRVIRTRDPLLIKVVRNISRWTYRLQEDLTDDKTYKQKGLWAPLVVPLIELCVSHQEKHEFLIEILAILANLTPEDLAPKLSWDQLLLDHSLAPFITKLLVPGFSQDDVILEVVQWISTLCLEPKTIPLLVTPRFIRMLYAIFHGKAQDQELTQQLLFVFYRLLRYPETFDQIMDSLDLISDLVARASAPTLDLERTFELLMDLVVNMEMQRCGKIGQYGERIRQFRFDLHNAEYLEIINDSMEASTLSR
uniref:Kinesinassociated protein putative n=1 Tax=Albugo laibachii Nc14 TaxID=890382 RepID=F0WYN6_9STRA|nr:kinesinassociated protein putative [Albugo laibachii Nc14]|eukprot:CCA26595.1 kinesinassociated protein putative [Albugo laibachii Nc14]